MADGNTYAINQYLDEREDWDALQEVTAELEQAEARIEELEAKLKAKEKLALDLAGDKIDLVSELAGVKGKLAKAIEDLKSIELMGDGPFNIAAYLIASRCIAELKGQDDE